MRKRTRARRLALQFLYQLDLRGEEVLAELESTLAASSEGDDVVDFARSVVMRYHEYRDEIDAVISAVAENWDLSRIAVVDRTIIRIAAVEILLRDDIPHRVSMNEAIELGKEFSTAQSGSFINGILDRIVKDRQRFAIARPKDS